MSSKLEFLSKRESEYKQVSGVGSFTVSVSFVPNFIDVVFSDLQKKIDSVPDTITWDLTATASGYDLVVNYNTGMKRTIKVVVAKLPVNPEQSISF